MTSRLRRRFGVAAAAVSTFALLLGGTAASAVAAEPAPLTCTSSTLAQVQQQILTEVNAARAASGVAPLVANSFMNDVATVWSQKQADAAKMGHNPDYSRQIPEGWSAAAENVAYGYTPTTVTTGWLNSSGHRANILGAKYTHIGIGVGCSAKRVAYYTQVFGAYTREPGVTAAPQSVKAAAEAGAAVVSWSTLTYSGAQAITGFIVTASPGGASVTVDGASRKTTVPGLTPGVSYTFTVRAINKYGTSAASQPSAAVTPTAPASTPTPAPTEPASGNRLSGPDRYSTSASISNAAFETGVPVVYLTSGAQFPDALSGGAAAGALGGPVLLVTPTGIPTDVRAELARLSPQRIILLGGTGTLADAVLDAARPYASLQVTRVAGTDRFATSAAISAATFAPGVSTVYLSNGLNFPDALSGGAAAAHEGAPVLLVTPGSIPAVVADELRRLRPGRIVLLGGEGTVSAAVAREAGALTAAPVIRHAGVDRYGTSAAISSAVFDPGVPVVYLASGANFPDALSGSAAAAVDGSPVLLTQPNMLPSVVRAELERLQPGRVVALGGTTTITEAVLAAAQQYAKG